MTNDEDRKAFEHPLVRAWRERYPGEHPERIDMKFAAGWDAAVAELAARDHYRKQVQELVEAVEFIDAVALDMGDHFDVPHKHFQDAADLAAKLKEHQDNG